MKRHLLIILTSVACIASFIACSHEKENKVEESNVKSILFNVRISEDERVCMRGVSEKSADSINSGLLITDSVNIQEQMRGASIDGSADGGYVLKGDELVYVSVKGQSGSSRSTTAEIQKYIIADGNAGISTGSALSLTYDDTGIPFTWMSDNEIITLRAWADGTTASSSTDPDGQKFTIETTQSGDYVKELLYAAPKDYDYSTYNTSGIEIPLCHQTARFVVNVLASKNSIINVTNVQIGSDVNPVPTSGTFTAPSKSETYGTWSNQGDENFITAKQENTASIDGCIGTYSAIVIPYDGTSGNNYYQAGHQLVSITTNEGGDTQTFVYVLGSSVNIEPGKQYTLNLMLQTRGDIFTVNNTGKCVIFSKGNLQATWNGSSWTWAFAGSQWDYVGNAVGNTRINGNGTVNADNVTVDLFGWVGKSNTTWSGTNGSGSEGEAAMHGISNSKRNDASAYGNVAGSNGETLKSDWSNVAITNGDGYTWRSLTSDEWIWLLGPSSSPNPGTNCRFSGSVNGTVNARWTYAKINTDGTPVCGLILFPDGLTITPSEASSYATAWGTINIVSAWGTKCTAAQWSNLAAKGCVFLPAAGYRDDKSVYTAGSEGLYWSSTADLTDARNAYDVYLGSSNLNPANYTTRYIGESVRLVREVN